MTNATPLSPVPGYDLDAPTHESAVAALARPLGRVEAERVWSTACIATGVPRAVPASLEELERVAGLLARERSVAGVCACSIVVRLISYSTLVRKLELRDAGQPVHEPHADGSEDA